MPITSEEREQVVSELKRFAHDLNLTDQQKERLQTALVEGREKIAVWRCGNQEQSTAKGGMAVCGLVQTFALGANLYGYT